MAANFTDIEKNLILAVKEVDSTTPTGHPNRRLADKKKGQGLWLQLHNICGDSSPVTLGDQGEDNHPGILQIDINYPEGRGSKQVLAKADAFVGFFTAGKALLYTAQEIRILSSSIGPGRYVGGYYRVSVSVNYYSRTFRS